MEHNCKWTCKTYRGAALTLGVSLWRIRYAVESGYLSAPSVVFKRRALFSAAQVDGMREYFEMEKQMREKAGGMTDGGMLFGDQK